MKITCLIALVVVITLAEETSLLQNFVDNNNKFASEIYKELERSNSGNFFVCPFSLEKVLTLIYTGAAGKTAQELSDSLHLPNTLEDIHETYRTLLRHLQSTKYYNLTITNTIYIDAQFHLIKEFRSTARSIFGAELQIIDLKQIQYSVNGIQNWVNAKIHDPKNCPPNLVMEDSTAFLLNYIQFQAKWARPFQKSATTRKSFWITNKRHVQIEVMEQTGDFVYYESSELKAKFVKLPYAGARDFMHLVIGLPNDKEGLPILEAQLNDAYALRGTYSQNVHVVLPKFTIKTDSDFKTILQNLGVAEIFENTARLPGIFEEDVRFGKVYQRGSIAISEDGIITSPATISVPIPISGDYQAPPPKEFIADHPFLFFITIKDLVLFTGRYSSPIGK